MTLRIQKKKFKRLNQFVKLMVLRHIRINTLNLHKKNNLYKGVDKRLIKFDNSLL